MSPSYKPVDLEQSGRNRSKEAPFTPPVGERLLKPLNLEIQREMVNLHMNVEILLPDTGAKIIQFIGSIENEGTSTIVREFAKVSALKFNKTVLVVDGNTRIPSQLEFFGIKAQCGLEDSYREGEGFKKAVHQIEGTRLFVGALRKSSAPIVGALDHRGFWKTLRKFFDLTLVDSPAANVSPDGLAISCRTDGVVLVLEAEKTRWPVAVHAKEKILKNGGKFLGMVLNKRKRHIPEQIYKNL